MTGLTDVPIIGICLVRNEDRFIAWSLNNVAAFCDRILVLDNGSTDGTRPILEAVAKTHPHIEIHDVPDAYDTHRFVEGFAGRKCWVLGVDGDEIYAPSALSRLRKRLSQGEFDAYWRLSGNTLHACAFDLPAQRASGYCPPASRSITKLYNFNAIESWSQGRHQRLHGKSMVFRPGFDAQKTYKVWEHAGWDAADLHCLHLCFAPRSSQTATGGGRTNPSEEMKAATPLRRLRKRIATALGIAERPNYKMKNYSNGPVVERSISDFGRPGDYAAHDPSSADSEAMLAKLATLRIDS